MLQQHVGKIESRSDGQGTHLATTLRYGSLFKPFTNKVPFGAFTKPSDVCSSVLDGRSSTTSTAADTGPAAAFDLDYRCTLYSTVRTRALVSACLLSPKARSLLQTPSRCGRPLEGLAAEPSIRNDQCCKLACHNNCFFPIDIHNGIDAGRPATKRAANAGMFAIGRAFREHSCVNWRIGERSQYWCDKQRNCSKAWALTRRFFVVSFIQPARM